MLCLLDIRTKTLSSILLQICQQTILQTQILTQAITQTLPLTQIITLTQIIFWETVEINQRSRGASEYLVHGRKGRKYCFCVVSIKTYN